MANQTQTVPLNLSFFPDDSEDDKPGVWLCRSNATDTDKILTFGLVLEPDSLAEEWWSKLNAGRKTTWTDVKGEFKTE